MRKMKFKTLIKIGVVVLLLIVSTFCYLKYVQPVIDALIEDAQDVEGE